MSIARIYILHANEGHDATLETVLRELCDHVRGLAGNEGVELLRDSGTELRFLFIQRWESIEAHEAAMGAFPADLTDRLMAVLDGPPDGGYYDSLLSA